jgi:excisionase family DNA binding protein
LAILHPAILCHDHLRTGSTGPSCGEDPITVLEREKGQVSETTCFSKGVAIECAETPAPIDPPAGGLHPAPPLRAADASGRVGRRSRPPNDYLSPTEVAERLGLARCTVYRMIGARELPFVEVRGRIRVAITDLDAFLARQRISSSEETARAQRAGIRVLGTALARDVEGEGRAAAEALGLLPGSRR